MLPSSPIRPVRNRHAYDRLFFFGRRCSKTTFAADKAEGQSKELREAHRVATLEQRHQLMNTEATVDNNFELFEAQRIAEIKVTAVKLLLNVHGRRILTLDYSEYTACHLVNLSRQTTVLGLKAEY